MSTVNFSKKTIENLEVSCDDMKEIKFELREMMKKSLKKLLRKKWRTMKLSKKNQLKMLLRKK